jgi:hypothetical protein
MNIPHLVRPEKSKFYPSVIAALRSAGGEWPVHVTLGTEGGYPGDIVVGIEKSATEYEASWEGADWTRFPARIRAACTALRDHGCSGCFRITHQEGVLRISRTDSLPRNPDGT